MTDEFECQYENCTESFEEKRKRLVHAMKDHHDLDPTDYPNMTGEEPETLF